MKTPEPGDVVRVRGIQKWMKLRRRAVARSGETGWWAIHPDWGTNHAVRDSDITDCKKAPRREENPRRPAKKKRRK